MSNELQTVIELNETVWKHLRRDLEDVGDDEVAWRPLPEANNINILIRHLRIEAEWQLAALEHGEPMPYDVTPEQQRHIDSIPFDFRRNLDELERFCTRFLAVLRNIKPDDLRNRSAQAYRACPHQDQPPHFLGFHHATHLARHWGQIRTIRNLYCKTHGQPARFIPVNPTFPSESHD